MTLNDILQGKSNLYLCDLSWMLHKNYHSFSNFCVDINGYKRPTGHIYGILYTLMTIKREDPDSVIIFCEDGEPVERNEIMAQSGEVGYKEGRPELEFNFYADVPLIKALVCSVKNVYWAYDSDKESDDALYALSRLAEGVENWSGRIFVYSGDNDLLQSIDSRVSVIRNRNGHGWDEITEEVVQKDEKFVKKFHGVDPQHIVNFRAICGDSSDRIKGIPRFPRDLASKFAMSCNKIEELSPQGLVIPREIKYYQILQDNMDVVKRNYKLMRLTEYTPTLTRPNPKKEAVDKVVSTFQLHTFSNYLEEERSNGQ